ncbi:MAG: SDR family oxidoreductase [Actinomycetota bacterium]
MSEARSTILITGASGFLGKGFVDHFLAEGLYVIGVANKGELPDRENFTPIYIDMNQVGAGEEIMEQASKVDPVIDFIINNAARQDVARLENESAKTAQDIFRVNLLAIGEIFSAIARHNFGVHSVVNITSIEAVSARPGHSMYGASKAALEALTKSAAHELAPIRINALRLGLIEREGIRAAWPEGVSAWEKRAPLKRMEPSRTR